MFCACGGTVSLRTQRGDRDAYEREYKRLECSACGKHTGWCGNSFPDQASWLEEQWEALDRPKIANSMAPATA